MTLVLDAGGVSALAGRRARLAALRDRGAWPPQVSAVVLTEALTGDHRTDFHANQLLRLCQVRDVTEPMARDAATLRTATGRAGSISAADAIVVAFAATQPSPIVLTSDRRDISALAAHSATAIAVAAV